MNIWAIDKDISIKLLLILLDEKINLEQLSIVQAVALNSKAIRFSDPLIEDLCAYIYSYGQVQDHYGVQLEYPRYETSQFYTTETFEEVTLTRLVDLLTVHFNLV